MFFFEFIWFLFIINYLANRKIFSIPESSSVLSLCRFDRSWLVRSPLISKIVLLSIKTIDGFVSASMFNFCDETSSKYFLPLVSVVPFPKVVKLIGRSEPELELRESIDPVHEGVGNINSDSKFFSGSILLIVLLPPLPAIRCNGNRRELLVWHNSPSDIDSESSSA